MLFSGLHSSRPETRLRTIPGFSWRVTQVHDTVSCVNNSISGSFSGNFRAGQTPGTVLKKLCSQEEEVYKKLMKDQHIRDYVPRYHKTIIVNDDDDQFIELEDLLR